MANVFYNKGKEWLVKEETDTSSYKIIFFDTSYTPNVDDEVYLSDVSASRASGSSDQSLANITITVDNTNNRVIFNADDVSISGQTFTTNKIGIYHTTGTDSTSTMIACIDVVEQAFVGGNVTVTWNADGIFAI